MLYVGGGVVFSGASQELMELAELTHMPVDMTLMGLGAFPGEHPQSMGMLGYARHLLGEYGHALFRSCCRPSGRGLTIA